MLAGLHICSCLLIAVNGLPSLCTVPRLGEHGGQEVAVQVGGAGTAHDSPKGVLALLQQCVGVGQAWEVARPTMCPASPARGLGPMKCEPHTPHSPPLAIPKPSPSQLGLSCWHTCHLWELEKEKPVGQGGACGLCCRRKGYVWSSPKFPLEVTKSFCSCEQRRGVLLSARCLLVGGMDGV